MRPAAATRVTSLRPLAFVAIALVATGCQASAEPELVAAAPESTAVAAPTAIPEPAAVPVAVPTGREAIAAAQGTAHILWFWGAHWGTCQRERSAVAHTIRQNSDVNIIGVTNPSEGDELARVEFAAGMSLQIPHVLDDSQDLWKAYDIASQPSMVFVQPDGSWERRVGGHDPVVLLDLATKLVTP